MSKKAEIIRKEVHLKSETIKGLQELADNNRRSLKNLMEYVLEKYLKDNKKKSTS